MMTTDVLVDDLPRQIRLGFGDEGDEKILRRWRIPSDAAKNSRVIDAVEFAPLTCKRWRYYRRALEVARSEAELRAAIARDAKAEVGFLFIARAEWFKRSPFLGFCYVRRTWCNHFLVDFAAVHPDILLRRKRRIVGTGSKLFGGLAELACTLGVPRVWGEATAGSQPFYEQLAGVSPILDQFVIEGPSLARCRARLVADTHLR